MLPLLTGPRESGLGHLTLIGFYKLELETGKPGVPFLIYQPNLDLACSTPEYRGGRTVLEEARRIWAYHDCLGVQLVVVLVPDKAQTYAEYL